MLGHAVIALSAGPALRIIANVERLEAPTPCAAYDVRRLINHLLYWGPVLEGAARKESVAPGASGEGAVDLTGQWSADLAAQVERMVTAWGKPEAWEGLTRMGGPTEMPASLVGGMVATELVVHTWDLARASGQEVSWDPALLDFMYAEVAKSAEQGRAMGVYGAAVPVPQDAPRLDLLLGLTGRNPHWSATP
jgi:uncharacterized protein (TIGR03086 family)